MSKDIASNPAAYIPRPSDGYKFQALCQHVFAVAYNSPGAAQFGRHGQDQHGLDILVHDFGSPSTRGLVKMVGVQCKFTVKEKLSSKVIAKVKDDMQRVVALVDRGDGYDHFELFVLATNLPNDSGLQTTLEELRAEVGAKFRVEVWDWDLLCSIIVRHPRLWDLFNEHPDLSLPIIDKTSVGLLDVAIRDAIGRGALAEASYIETQWRNGRAPAYGHLTVSPPPEIWQRSAQLRESLLELYRAGADSYSAVPVLQYQLGLNQTGAGHLLEYLTAQRIVGNLRFSSSPFRQVGERPQFQSLVAGLLKDILAAAGTPDELASLALMLVMELDDVATHDAALVMMEKVVVRASGTEWETVARVVHATVRYYYVLRNGWRQPARRYSVGDTIEDVTRANRATFRLDMPFDDPGPGVIGIMHMDPLGPMRNSGSGSAVLRRLCRHFGVDGTRVLVALTQQCKVYSVDDYGATTTLWRGDVRSLSNQRVVVFDTLAMLAGHRHYQATLNRFGLVATELSFERLLGYRRLLHAYAARSTDDRSPAQLLQHVDHLVDVCVAGRASQEALKGRITITPVYDNPPPRPPVELGAWELPPSCFTLAKEVLLDRARWIAMQAPQTPLLVGLEMRYSNRRDEFGLACLLALHRCTPMLDYEYRRRAHANAMGIGVEHPEALTDGTTY
ncbi:hypothetical protein [Rugamonas aquatica]|uniref:hypothetical protein n=1 Tax=Rugamonas aquatica TaxID=2743357 RepID=UPI001581AF71|nr:hypothetical protein [Rugamonas aquatica]